MKTRPFIIILILVLAVLIISSCATSGGIRRAYLEDIKYRAIFTTNLDENYDPVNNIKEISIDAETIFLYVDWFNFVPGHKYKEELKILGPEEELIWYGTLSNEPTEPYWYSYWWYEPSQIIDPIGEWSFEYYFDGVKLFTKKLIVLPSTAKLKRLKKNISEDITIIYIDDQSIQHFGS